MNVSQLRGNVGALVRLRPLPTRVNPVDRLGPPLEPLDEPWAIARVADGVVELRHLRTGHVARLGNDNVREFRSPDFLLLHCRLILDAAYGVSIEPLTGREHPA